MWCGEHVDHRAALQVHDGGAVGHPSALRLFIEAELSFMHGKFP
jgi:hypothetical protein